MCLYFNYSNYLAILLADDFVLISFMEEERVKKYKKKLFVLTKIILTLKSVGKDGRYSYY